MTETRKRGAGAAAGRAKPLSLERTPLGPRVYVLGRRVHEWQLGSAVLLASVLVWLTANRPEAAALGAVVGAWLLLKDWRDLVPRYRDSAAWRFGLHRVPAPLRDRRRGDWVPPLAAAVTATVASVSFVSALDPALSIFDHPVLHTDALGVVPTLHAFALPLASMLAVVSVYLVRRRFRAWQLAFALTLALAVGAAARGEIGDAALAVTGSVLLWWGRDAFQVRHDPLKLHSTAWRLPLLALGAGSAAAVAVSATAPGRPTWPAIVRETLDLLTFSPGPIHFGDAMAWQPLGVGSISAFAVAAAAWMVFRPLAAPRALPDAAVRAVAASLVRSHGTDTLSFFKLRPDCQLAFSPDGQALVAYRIDSGVLLVSGDPVGAPESIPAAVAAVCRVAEQRGLRIGGVGAGAALLPVWSQAGLRALYIGDEAIVETREFSLEGRPIRKVRQSVSRLETAGYTAEVCTAGSLDQATMTEVESLSARWLAGAAERGFSMAMDSLCGAHLADSTLVLARDREGAVRGFLQLVPVSRRPAMSLSVMRRDRNTPNGLMEFLVVRAIENLRECGVEELSLNFAAFARWMQQPESRVERALGRGLAVGNRWFQLESLYRFNAKFFPRWEPRYLLYDSRLALPRIGLAALWVEGQLPRPRLLGWKPIS